MAIIASKSWQPGIPEDVAQTSPHPEEVFLGDTPTLLLTYTACGVFFLTGLLAGVWKYAHIHASRDGKAQAREPQPHTSIHNVSK